MIADQCSGQQIAFPLSATRRISLKQAQSRKAMYFDAECAERGQQVERGHCPCDSSILDALGRFSHRLDALTSSCLVSIGRFSHRFFVKQVHVELSLRRFRSDETNGLCQGCHTCESLCMGFRCRFARGLLDGLAVSLRR